jgi:HEAT repeat protein
MNIDKMVKKRDIEGLIGLLSKGADIYDNYNIDLHTRVVYALGILGDPLALDPLIKAYHEQHKYVRYAVIETLGQFHDPRALDILKEALCDPDDFNVRLAAVRSISRLNDSHAIVPLIKAVYDDAVSVSREASKALDKLLEHPDAVQELITALIENRDDRVRIKAAKLLAGSRDPRAVEPLIKALRDENMGVRLEAVKGLKEFSDPGIVESLIQALEDKDNDNNIRSEAIFALGETRAPRAFEPLMRALENPGTKETAAVALGRLGGPRTVEPLIELLKDELWIIHESAAEALGKLKDPRSIEPLIQAIHKSPKAIWALGELNDPRAIEPLVHALDDVSWTSRKEAALSLIKIAKGNSGFNVFTDKVVMKITSPHTDRHADKNSSSDCGSSSSHADEGIGITIN